MSDILAQACPRCGESNHYDLAELRAQKEQVWRGLREEFIVSCQRCHHTYVLIVEASDVQP